jgi:hypothetical protein
MGLQVDASMRFWSHVQAGESAAERRRRAAQEGWYPELSEARLKYLLSELEKRFPQSSLPALQAWSPEGERQAPLVCHWHLQCSDPLYRDFTSSYLVRLWARPDHGLSVAEVDAWLAARAPDRGWSATTRRRLASGLLGAAAEAGLLKGSGRKKEVRTVNVDAASMGYLRSVLLAAEEKQGPAEAILLSGMVVAPA